MIANFLKNQTALVLSIVLLLVASIAGTLYVFNRQVGNTIYPHTYIDGINMGNKTKTEAKALLQRRDDYLNNVLVEVMYKDIPVSTFSAETINIHRDIQAKVDQAYIIGRTPHVPSRIMQQINSLTGSQKISFQTNGWAEQGDRTNSHRLPQRSADGSSLGG